MTPTEFSKSPGVHFTRSRKLSFRQLLLFLVSFAKGSIPEELRRFYASRSAMPGDAPYRGHTECDSIIMDEGKILAMPSLEANHVDAAPVHEAAIGKIAGDQLIKLMTLGLTEQEAEEQIINGFLR